MSYRSWNNPWTRSPSDDGYRFNPLHLGPYAYYDAHVGGSSTGITDSSYNARAAVTVGAGSNSPLWLPYTVPTVTIPSAGSITAPDSTAFAFTGDQDIRWCGTVPDWTPAANSPLMAQDSGGADGRRFTFYLTSTGKLGLIWSTDGTAVVSKVSTVGSSLTDGTVGAVRVTLDVDDGAGNNVVRFYQKAATSLAEISDNSGWTLLDTVTTVGTTTISGVSTDSLRIGSSGAVAVNQCGVVAAAYLDGINGTAVATFDAALCRQSGYTDSLGNVWTVNRPTSGRKAVVQSPAANSARSLFLLGTDDYLTAPNAAVAIKGINSAFTYVLVHRRWATPTSWIMADFSNFAAGPGMRLENSGTNIFVLIGDGSTTVSATAAAPYGVRNITAVTNAAASRVTSISVNAGAASSSGALAGSATRDPANGLMVGGGNGVTPVIFTDMEFEALLTFNRELSTGEIAQLVAYYGGGL